MAYNEVSDVSPLSMIDTLQLVDLESNNIETLDQVKNQSELVIYVT